MNFNKCEMILSCTLLQYNLYKDSYDDNDVLPLLFDSLNLHIHICERVCVCVCVRLCMHELMFAELRFVTQWHRSWECFPFSWPLLFKTILNKVRTFISIYFPNTYIYIYLYTFVYGCVCVCRSSGSKYNPMENSMSRSTIGNKACISDVKLRRRKKMISNNFVRISLERNFILRCKQSS